MPRLRDILFTRLSCLLLPLCDDIFGVLKRISKQKVEVYKSANALSAKDSLSLVIEHIPSNDVLIEFLNFNSACCPSLSFYVSPSAHERKSCLVQAVRRRETKSCLYTQVLHGVGGDAVPPLNVAQVHPLLSFACTTDG